MTQVDTTPETDFTISGTTADESFAVVGGPNSPDPTTRVAAGGTDIIFANKQRVLIEGGGGNDTIDFGNPDPAAGLQSVVLDGFQNVSQSLAVNYASLAVVSAGLEGAQVSLTRAGNNVGTIAASLTGFNPLFDYLGSSSVTVGTV